jgi:Putative Ig domain/IPT/TIG domain
MSTLSVQTIRDIRSMDFSNTEFAGAYNASNAAFAAANASFGVSNSVNSFAYGVAINAAAAFAAANNVGPQIAPAFNTANASYGKANTSLQNTSGTFAGNLSITGNVDFSLGTSHIILPSGNTAQRPSGINGMIRYNNQTGFIEQYSSGIWTNFTTAPIITSVSPTTFNGEQGTLFTINGANFDNAPVVKFVTSSGTEYAAAATSRVSSTQLTATTPQDFTVANEPLKVKVTNESGLSITLDSAIDCGGVPAWSNASGSIGSFVGGVTTGIIANVTATDPDSNSTITYSVTSGSLPPGLYLGSSNGNIFGTTTGVASNTTYSFTITATDNAGNETPRAFSLLGYIAIESGGGAGYYTASSTATVADQITNNSMTLYYANAQAASPNNPTQWLNFTWSSGSFMIHTGHDGVKPTYLCFNLTSGTPRVLNRFRWYKHANACGNIDFYGSNQNITSGNYQTMGNWTYLGRGFMGGSGSEGDGTIKTATFNSNKYGYRWYMVLVRDNAGSLAYPSEGSMGGYAMYGATFDYTG